MKIALTMPHFCLLSALLVAAPAFAESDSTPMSGSTMNDGSSASNAQINSEQSDMPHNTSITSAPNPHTGDPYYDVNRVMNTTSPNGVGDLSPNGTVR